MKIDTNNNILKKNLSCNNALQQLFDSIDDIYPIEMTKLNCPTIKINNIYYHSKYNPIKEAENVATSMINNENIDVFIVYGYGLGYIVNEIYKKLIVNNHSNIKPYLLIVEPDKKIFATSLHYFDCFDILNDTNVRFFVDTDKTIIGSFLQNIPTKYIRYYIHRPSYNENVEYYKSVQNYISYVLDRKDMNSATLTRFQKIWSRNSIKNLPYINQVNHLSKLQNIAKSSNAVVIGGGPTLMQSLEWLKKVENNCIIIVVDTAYKYLLKNGIKPDIIVTVDPQYYNYKYLEDAKITNEIIVTDQSIYYQVFSIASPNKFFVGNSIFPLNKYFEQTHNRGTLAAGGSVANTAFDIARIIGASNIYLLGIDLSYLNRMTHFKGAFFETNFISHSNYFTTTELGVYKYLTHVPLCKTENTNQSVVDTDQKMMIFKKWFDREVPLTNATTYQPDFGGAKIIGTKIINLTSTNVSQYEKQEFYNRLKEICSIKQENNINEIKQKIEIFIKNTNILIEEYNKIISKISENGDVSPKNIEIIENIEQKVSQNVELTQIAEILSVSAHDVMTMIVENYQLSNNEISNGWIKTRLLYKSIVESSVFFIKNMKKTLKILSK